MALSNMDTQTIFRTLLVFVWIWTEGVRKNGRRWEDVAWNDVSS
jgi:hypothetical protein